MKKTERKPKGTTSTETDAPKAEVAKRRTTAHSADDLSLPEIKQLIELISEKQFNEFELERGSFRLRLSKGLEKSPTGQGAESAIITPSVTSAPVAAPVVVPALSSVTASAPSAPPEEDLHILNSPIVGTFYRSPSPTTASFVNVGDSVEVGKVVCIIEAMKLMNEIQSDTSGTIAKIFVESGQPIEFGQPLFGIKK
ncbi:MAG: acetyl-CoA carboxylase biotin carboxyl carrier protein [Acidobacteriota bacterium]|nr:acetyl-CoA carboxylase biotin carboxyl carrier protein [Acidobacteriota bacterium]